MREAIRYIKLSLEDLIVLDAALAHKGGTASGILRDTSNWIENNSRASVTCLQKSLSILYHHEPMEVIGELEIIRDRLNSFVIEVDGTLEVGTAYGMKNVADFKDMYLEDCILGLQQAIQILEEAQNE